jgi:hypothetical protein
VRPSFRDLEQPVSILACHLTEEFGYLDSGEFTATFRVTEPFGLEFDLAALS